MISTCLLQKRDYSQTKDGFVKVETKDSQGAGVRLVLLIPKIDFGQAGDVTLEIVGKENELSNQPERKPSVKSAFRRLDHILREKWKVPEFPIQLRNSAENPSSPTGRSRPSQRESWFTRAISGWSRPDHPSRDDI
jgi:hypothetical protein